MLNISCSMCAGGGCQSTTVPAGEVAVSLAACGYETAAQKLPRMTVAEQVYSTGLCPGCALSKGTLFPELISEY